MSDQNRIAIEYLCGLAEQEFWGSISIKFEAGKIVHVRREENLKLWELSGKLRLFNECKQN